MTPARQPRIGHTLGRYRKARTLTREAWAQASMRAEGLARVAQAAGGVTEEEMREAMAGMGYEVGT